MKGPPLTYRRIAVEAAGILALQIAAAYVLAHLHVAEHLLAPGENSYVALAATAIFLLLRGFVLVLAPGWVLARIWLCWTHQHRDSR